MIISSTFFTITVCFSNTNENKSYQLNKKINSGVTNFIINIFKKKIYFLFNLSLLNSII